MLKNVRISEIPVDSFLPSRPDITEGVFASNLIPPDLSDIRVLITNVKPNGEFQSHKDTYHHIFYFIEGNGYGWVDETKYEIFPGRIVEIPAGTIHGYKNTSPKDLLLITVNIPVL